MRPSSGELKNVTAATGVCHELGWNNSCIDVQGRLRSAQPTLNIYTGFTPSQLMTKTSGCCYSFSAPDDGRKGRPKHVEHTRS